MSVPAASGGTDGPDLARARSGGVVTGLRVSLKVAVSREDGVGHRPQWFEQFLADRGTRKPSAHTLKAYRQDFDAIAALLADDRQDLVHCRFR